MKKMTNIILSTLMVFTMTIANAQGKKKQIENLTFSLDSLNQAVVSERQSFNTTLDSLDQAVVSERQSFNTTLDNLNQVLSKNQQDFELEMDKSSITIKNLNSQLIRLNSINDSLSNGITRRQIRIDSISLALDSIILVANRLESGWSSITADKPYYNYHDNTDMLRHLLTQILRSRTSYLMSLTDDYFYKNNIKELTIYKSYDSFKTLVDNIYELGFVICQGEGAYYVEPKSSKCRVEHDGVD